MIFIAIKMDYSTPSCSRSLEKLPSIKAKTEGYDAFIVNSSKASRASAAYIKEGPPPI